MTHNRFAWILLALAATAPAAAQPLRASTGALRGPCTVSTTGYNRTFHPTFSSIVAPGSAPGRATIVISTEGYTCRLDAQITSPTTFTLPPGQRCHQTIRIDDYLLDLDATLRSGAATQAVAGLQHLELQWGVRGNVSHDVPVPFIGSTRVTIPVPNGTIDQNLDKVP